MARKRGYTPYCGRSGKRIFGRILLVLVLLAVVAFGCLEGVIAANGRTKITGEPGAMIIFGCQVKPWGPSVLLQDRLDAALDYLEENPDIKVVVTGGKGDDEHQSEAQCMYDYLTAHGVDGENIYMEEQSRNTWQNLNYSLDLLKSKGYGATGDLLAVSNDFHLARIRMLYGRVYNGKYLSTLAAPSSHLPTKIKMFFREPLALAKSFLLDRGEPHAG